MIFLNVNLISIQAINFTLAKDIQNGMTMLTNTNHTKCKQKITANKLSHRLVSDSNLIATLKLNNQVATALMFP